jgi:hypothetical protein
MRIQSLRIFISLAVICGVAPADVNRAANPEPKRAFVFRDVAYFYRWSKNDQTEFTPEKQEDLDKWADMITVNGYPDVRDGERLAAVANAVLENYKSHQGAVLKTRSVPRGADRPAEHFIAVRFTRPGFIEIAFARFTLVNGKGHSFVYSHRVYGAKIEEQMNAWLKANGDEVEKALLEWTGVPSII